MKKKKKKNVILIRKVRKVRQRSTNKTKIYYCGSFVDVFKSYCYDLQYNFEFSFFGFIKLFHYTCANRIYNYMKYFGMNSSYFVKKKTNFSKKSKKIIFKYNLKSKKNLNKEKKNFYILSKKFVKSFKKFEGDKIIRYNNLHYKKVLCLHVSYRHILILPVRGQRTKTNGKTRKNFNIQ